MNKKEPKFNLELPQFERLENVVGGINGVLDAYQKLNLFIKQQLELDPTLQKRITEWEDRHREATVQLQLNAGSTLLKIAHARMWVGMPGDPFAPTEHPFGSALQKIFTIVIECGKKFEHNEEESREWSRAQAAALGGLVVENWVGDFASGRELDVSELFVRGNESASLQDFMGLLGDQKEAFVEAVGELEKVLGVDVLDGCVEAVQEQRENHPLKHWALEFQEQNPEALGRVLAQSCSPMFVDVIHDAKELMLVYPQELSVIKKGAKSPGFEKAKVRVQKTISEKLELYQAKRNNAYNSQLEYATIKRVEGEDGWTSKKGTQWIDWTKEENKHKQNLSEQRYYHHQQRKMRAEGFLTKLIDFDERWSSVKAEDAVKTLASQKDAVMFGVNMVWGATLQSLIENNMKANEGVFLSVLRQQSEEPMPVRSYIKLLNWIKPSYRRSSTSPANHRFVLKEMWFKNLETKELHQDLIGFFDPTANLPKLEDGFISYLPKQIKRWRDFVVEQNQANTEKRMIGALQTSQSVVRMLSTEINLEPMKEAILTPLMEIEENAWKSFNAWEHMKSLALLKPNFNKGISQQDCDWINENPEALNVLKESPSQRFVTALGKLLGCGGAGEDLLQNTLEQLSYLGFEPSMLNQFDEKQRALFLHFVDFEEGKRKVLTSQPYESWCRWLGGVMGELIKESPQRLTLFLEALTEKMEESRGLNLSQKNNAIFGIIKPQGAQWEAPSKLLPLLSEWDVLTQRHQKELTELMLKTNQTPELEKELMKELIRFSLKQDYDIAAQYHTRSVKEEEEDPNKLEKVQLLWGVLEQQHAGRPAPLSALLPRSSLGGAIKKQVEQQDAIVQRSFNLKFNLRKKLEEPKPLEKSWPEGLLTMAKAMVWNMNGEDLKPGASLLEVFWDLDARCEWLTEQFRNKGVKGALWKYYLNNPSEGIEFLENQPNGGLEQQLKQKAQEFSIQWSDYNEQAQRQSKLLHERISPLQLRMIAKLSTKDSFKKMIQQGQLYPQPDVQNVPALINEINAFQSKSLQLIALLNDQMCKEFHKIVRQAWKLQDVEPEKITTEHVSKEVRKMAILIKLGKGERLQLRENSGHLWPTKEVQTAFANPLQKAYEKLKVIAQEDPSPRAQELVQQFLKEEAWLHLGFSSFLFDEYSNDSDSNQRRTAVHQKSLPYLQVLLQSPEHSAEKEQALASLKVLLTQLDGGLIGSWAPETAGFIQDVTDYFDSVDGMVWTELPEKISKTSLKGILDEWHQTLIEKEAQKVVSQRSWLSWAGVDLINDRTLMAKELRTATEMLEEGTIMHHCVSSYSAVCRSNDKRIFSLQHNGRRVGTLELSAYDAKGKRVKFTELLQQPVDAEFEIRNTQFKGAYNATIRNPLYQQFAEQVIAAVCENVKTLRLENAKKTEQKKETKKTEKETKRSFVSLIEQKVDSLMGEAPVSMRAPGQKPC